MSLTRRHFELIAGIIRELPPGTRVEVAEHFASRLTRTNPNFKRERFIRAATDG